MGIFDKLKDGASKAADLAKDSVEIAKINSQISGKRKEIEKSYLLIGKEVYDAYTNKQLDTLESLVKEQSNLIRGLEEEVEQLEYKIRQIKDEKECVCGRVVPMDTKFCPSCGHQFEEIVKVVPVEEQTADEIIIVQKHCGSCHEIVNESDLFCEKCGNRLAP
ncbi:zinc ribbon domain-containing protein [Paenibacillus sp. D2_2]|uniref:zinc ribbon domain-containing protein n=1 Tax=Paenibacillus sp. D2_2 TaxID=3073092 RepID=UPI002815E623|nr:zinc ribbon domain-containing protein [Paenibacillus sp. D2_2]WMT41641.1 zinc ribbon domain-containing protein [Paenibacillus sp. D2_2]